MDGGEILILFEGAPAMEEAPSFGIKEGVETAAFFGPRRKYKKAGSNDPGDRDEKPRTAYFCGSGEQFVPEGIHRPSILKIRAKISRLKVVELRQKSSQGRK